MRAYVMHVCVCVWCPPELVAAIKFAIYKQVQCLQRHGAVKVFFFKSPKLVLLLMYV